jgi:hypothetical protein
MGIGGYLSRAVAAVAQLDGVLVPEGIPLPVLVAGEAEALSIMGIEGDHIHGGGDILRLQPAGTVGSEVRIVAGEALDGGAKGIGKAIVAVLNSAVTEIAQLRPSRGDCRRLAPLRGLGLMAEYTGPVIPVVRRALRQPLAVAVPAEVLPGLEKGGLLRSREAPEKGVIRFGCVVEMAGCADDLSLEVSGASKGEKGRLLYGDGSGARLDEYGVEILLGFVAVGAQRGIVECPSSPECRCFPRVDTEARRLLMAEKTLRGVVLVGGRRQGSRREGEGK